MSGFRVTGQSEEQRKKVRCLLAGGMAAALLAGFCGFPLPALLNGVKYTYRLHALQQRKQFLMQEAEKASFLKRTLLPMAARISRETEAAHPRVRDLFTLRDLLLAQAHAAGVLVEEALFQPPSIACPFLPGTQDLLYRTHMELKGRGGLERVILFVGMVEVAGRAFRVEEAELAPASTERPDVVEFRLDVAALFRGPPDLVHDRGPETGEGAAGER